MSFHKLFVLCSYFCDVYVIWMFNVTESSIQPGSKTMTVAGIITPPLSHASAMTFHIWDRKKRSRYFIYAVNVSIILILVYGFLC